MMSMIVLALCLQEVPEPGRAPILLSTPILDDVTLYFDCGGPKIVGWVSL